MGSKGTMKSFWIGKVYHVTGYVVGFERKCLSIDTIGTKECAVLRKLPITIKKEDVMVTYLK